MKLGILRSVGHNMADSLASGIGLMVGVYSVNVFGEAACDAAGYIEVDFLQASTAGSPASESLREAIRLYRLALVDLCVRQGVEVTEFRKLVVRYGTDRVYGPHFTVTIEGAQGRHAVDRYVGIPGKRLFKKNARSRVSPPSTA